MTCRSCGGLPGAAPPLVPSEDVVGLFSQVLHWALSSHYDTVMAVLIGIAWTFSSNRGAVTRAVADADLVFFLLDKAARAIETRLANVLGLSMAQAAWGIHSLVNENMASAAKVYVGARDGRLYAFALESGKLLWSYDSNEELIAKLSAELK